MAAQTSPQQQPQPQQLVLRKFNLDSLGDRRFLLVIGKRATGKSCLIADILYHIRKKIPIGIVCSGSEEANGFYQKFVPPIFTYNELDFDAIERLIARQKAAAKQNKLKPAFIVIDDLAFDKKIFNTKVMRYIAMNGRHLALFCVLSVQYALDLPPAMRSNVDFVFILRENIRSNRARLYQQFAGMFPNYDTFAEVLDATTQNYECLVVDNVHPSCDPAQVCSWYKAKIRQGFRLCAPSVWDYSRRHYNPRHDDHAVDPPPPPQPSSGAGARALSKARPTIVKLR